MLLFLCFSCIQPKRNHKDYKIRKWTNEIGRDNAEHPEPVLSEKLKVPTYYTTKLQILLSPFTGLGGINGEVPLLMLLIIEEVNSDPSVPCKSS